MTNISLSAGRLKSLHHSASAPALSSLTTSQAVPSNSSVDLCRTMKKELLEKLGILSRVLPPNTLDELIDDLGGPDNVAEVREKEKKFVYPRVMEER